jgi:hypothetical protein
MFQTKFGRGYYEGFTDSAPDLVPVPFAPERDDAPSSPSSPKLRPRERSLRLSAGAGLSGSTAEVLGPSHGVRLSLSRANGHGPSLSLDGLTASDGPLTEWRATGTLGWLWQTRPSTFQLYASLRAGAGIVVQQVEGDSARSTAAGVGATSTGIATHLAAELGMFAEIELAGQLLQRDGAARVDSVPSAWIGSYWGW